MQGPTPFAMPPLPAASQAALSAALSLPLTSTEAQTRAWSGLIGYIFASVHVSTAWHECGVS